ncbi:hypothetical protein QQ045_014024 [Rhodiola kirilowii]
MLEADDNHHHEEEIEQGKEVEHKESLMDKISEKLHGHDSSSDSGEDEKTSSVKSKIFRLFGREKPVHKVFGGGKRLILLEDYHLVEKHANFDRERIPERVVHARGANAKGLSF